MPPPYTPSKESRIHKPNLNLLMRRLLQRSTSSSGQTSATEKPSRPYLDLQLDYTHLDPRQEEYSRPPYKSPYQPRRLPDGRWPWQRKQQVDGNSTPYDPSGLPTAHVQDDRPILNTLHDPLESLDAHILSQADHRLNSQADLRSERDEATLMRHRRERKQRQMRAKNELRRLKLRIKVLEKQNKHLQRQLAMNVQQRKSRRMSYDVLHLRARGETDDILRCRAREEAGLEMAFAIKQRHHNIDRLMARFEKHSKSRRERQQELLERLNGLQARLERKKRVALFEQSCLYCSNDECTGECFPRMLEEDE